MFLKKQRRKFKYIPNWIAFEWLGYWEKKKIKLPLRKQISQIVWFFQSVRNKKVSGHNHDKFSIISFFGLPEIHS